MNTLKKNDIFIIKLALAFFVIFFVSAIFNSNNVYAGCCNADFPDCGICSNCDAGPDNGQYEWADNYCNIGANTGPGEACEGYAGDCSTRNCTYHGSCCGSCGPPPPPPPPPKMDIGGYVTNSATGAAIPNIIVRICGSNGTCTNATTAADGSYRNNTFVNQSLNSFQVTIQSANIPAGYTSVQSVFAPNGTNMSNTHLHTACGGGDTVFGSTNGYQCQTWDENNSCAQAGGGTGNTRRCNLALTPVAPPVLYGATPSCINQPPYNKIEFSWQNVTGADDYILRVNKWNDPVPPAPDWSPGLPADYWLWVDEPTFCTGATCNFEIIADIPPTATQQYFQPLPGLYDWWSVCPVVGGIEITTSCVTGPAFTGPSCYPYSISGQVNLVSDDGTCSLASPTPINNYADISNLDVIWTTNGYTYTLTEDVNGNSTYSLPNPVTDPGLPGSTGNVRLNNGGTTTLQATGPLSGFISYQPECIQIGSVPPAPPSAYQTSAGSALIPVNNSFSANMTNFNFGYKEVNLFPDGWFASLNGDTYGRDIVDISMPGAGGGAGGNIQGACEGYLSFGDDSGQYEVAAFGFNVDLGDSYMSDTDKFIKNFAGDFWPTDFTFVPNTDPSAPNYAAPITVSTITGGNLEAGKVYSITDTLINSFLNSNTSYTFSASSPDGVAIIYVTNQHPIQTFEFNNAAGLVSTDPDKRILFISQEPVFISKDIGSDPATLLTGNSQICDIDSLASTPHIQAGIIANGDITVEGNGTNTDKVLIIEGPFVAGSPDPTDNISISFERNLGTYNGIYPATIVKYNPLYMTALTEDSGLQISNVTWSIDPDSN